VSIRREDVEEQFHRLRHLTQYAKHSEKDLWEVARWRVFEDEMQVVSRFKDKPSRVLAKKLLRNYFDDYSIESIADKNTLQELIYLEVVQARFQERLEQHYEEDSKAIPISLLNTIHENSEIITKLKDTLGLNRQKNLDKSPYDVLQHLLKRGKKWREENQASRTLKCPHCSEMILLKIKTDIWEAQGHPFFKDRVLYNKHLVKLYKAGKITKDDFAKVLETSVFYVDWLLEKIHKEPILEADSNAKKEEKPEKVEDK